jgi:hypothetical protein
LSDTDPYADPAAPNVYYPPVAVLKEAEAEVVTAPVEDAAAPETEEAVPAGTISEIVEWVGTDPERAARALAAEEAGLKRKSLIKTLTAVV